jgi:hypothetical protein
MPILILTSILTSMNPALVIRLFLTIVALIIKLATEPLVLLEFSNSIVVMQTAIALKLQVAPLD